MIPTSPKAFGGFAGQTDDAAWSAAGAGELSKFLAAQFAPPADEPMSRWWEQNIVVSSGEFPGEYRTDLTPLAGWISVWMQDPRVKRIVMVGAAQTLKTRTLSNFFLWAVAENPGTVMLVTATIESCREFWMKRLEPDVMECGKVAGRYLGRNKDLIRFESLNLLLRGTNSRVGMQGDPVKWLLFDERREWRAGAIDMLRMRTRTMTEFKEISAGTAGPAGGPLDADFLEGSQTQGHFRCLDCGESQPFRFGREATTVYLEERAMGGIVSVDEAGQVQDSLWNDYTRPGGVWNWERLRASVRFQCQKCGRLYQDHDKYELLKTLHPVDYNPAAPPEYRSITWNAFQFVWKGCQWGNLTEQFCRAIDSLKNPTERNIHPLRAFVTETLGEAWKDDLGQVVEWGFIDELKQDYSLGEKWTEEETRYMTADVQGRHGEHYWWLVRAFAPGGKSRLIAFGRVEKLEDLLEHQRRLGVKTENCGIDCTGATRRRRFTAGARGRIGNRCVATGAPTVTWCAMKKPR